MGNAVAAKELGDIYQAMVFWKYAIQMFGDSDIGKVGYEYGEVSLDCSFPFSLPAYGSASVSSC